MTDLIHDVEAEHPHWGPVDLHGWQVLRPLLDGRSFLPFTEGSMSPAGLATVASEISLAERRVLVELGSGVSTIVLARLAAQLGGRVFALEHDPGWAGWVERQLERDGLSEVATVIEAPLAEHPLSLDGAPWYAPDALGALPSTGIDLLLIDGPPGYGEGMARSRYPALPVLDERLAPGALVVLDDAERTGEAEILDSWERDGAWRFDRRAAERIAVGRRA